MTDADEDWRQLVSKKFSPENPYSQYCAAVLETTTDVLDTYFEPLTKDKNYDYEEKVARKYTPSEVDNLRTALAKNALDKSVAFESDLFEVVAFTW
jgi:hypothetical protein